jgi:hypothetical protein
MKRALVVAAVTLAAWSALDPSLVAAAEPQGISLIQSGKTIAADGSYYIPLNNNTSTVALFSEQREPFTLKNTTTSPIQVIGMWLRTGPGVVTESFALQSNALNPTPLQTSGFAIEPGKSLDFYVRFYPVRGGLHEAKLVVSTNAGNLDIKLSGRGQTEAAFYGNVAWEKVHGAPNKNELTTGMVADPQGALFLASNVVNTTYEDIMVSRVNGDGSLAWAKTWGGPFRDMSRDPGQNGESGGSADAISRDAAGNVYVVGSSAGDKNNNTYFALVLKINPRNGEIVWQKAFGFGSEVKFTKQSAEAYSVDASGKYIYVTGTTGANVGGPDSQVLFLALDPADGSIKSKAAFDVTPGVNDRGYAIHHDGKGSAYIGGVSGATAMLLKVGDIETPKPKLVWSKKVELGVGGNINSLDVDRAGNVFVALDRRGATSAFSAGKFDPTGKLLWAKTYTGNSGDKNNIHVVRVQGNDVYLGGRIGAPNFDTQYGDGLFVRLAADDGKLLASSFHYSGKGPSDIAEHRIKGIAASGNALFLATQVFTGNFNGVRYAGYWYSGLGKLEDYAPATSDITGAAVNTMADGAVFDASTKGKWSDAPKATVFQNAVDKKDGKAPDPDVMVTKLETR